jgi:hypothetical protein
VLAENYLYTQEAIASMYRHLAPGGILQISRFAGPLEALRLLSNVHGALRSLGVADSERAVTVLATLDFMMSVQVKRGEFSAEELASTAAFAKDSGIHPLYLSNRRDDGIAPALRGGAPAASLVERFLRAPDKRAYIAAFPGNLEPTVDDRPYFFNFARWRHPIESVRAISDIPSVSQGNPFFLYAQLLLAAVLSALLIALPIARARGTDPSAERPRGAFGFLAYFSALGAGFILIEIATIQKLTLLLGQPIYSLIVTLFALLVFTGLGSLLFAGRFASSSRAVLLVPAAIALYLLAFNLGSPALVARLIGADLPVRIAGALLALAPLGLLLGIPFAYGLRVVAERAPSLAPWAWAINGCMSVVGSISSVIVSMNFGFSAVLGCAAVIYLLGFAALAVTTRS